MSALLSTKAFFAALIKSSSCERAIELDPRNILMLQERPSDLSYGQLKLMPYLDSLRGDPRFEKLVEEAKKPVALK